MRLSSLFVHLTVALGVTLAAGCGGRLDPPAPEGDDVAVRAAGILRPAERNDERLEKPALIATDMNSGALVYWPTTFGAPRYHPITFTKPLGAYSSYAMAANGDTLVIANINPSEIITYDVKTKQKKTLSDSYGMPNDVAIGKNGDIYAMFYDSITVYAASSYSQTELLCNKMTDNQAIAVDNEGDVFVNGTADDGTELLVVEYPANGGACEALKLQPEVGYPGGVGVDPKTDDLIVVDNPGLCAGSEEGRMTIYPKPYRRGNFKQVDLNATYCDGIFRLDKDSKHIYVADETVSSDGEVIDVRTYPDGIGVDYYAGSYGQVIGGFTTIPNRLPN
jgi:hypothetical protein